MLRHVPKPLHTGGFEADVGVEAAGDGAVNDGLLLLLQQLDQLLLGADVAPDPPVRVVEEPDDGGLFGERWDRIGTSPMTVEISVNESAVPRLSSSPLSVVRTLKATGTRTQVVVSGLEHLHTSLVQDPDFGNRDIANRCPLRSR